jgi:hypothetical protein
MSNNGVLYTRGHRLSDERVGRRGADGTQALTGG